MSQPFEIDGFIVTQGVVTFQVDMRGEIGTITFMGPNDYQPLCSGKISQYTLNRVIKRFQNLPAKQREWMFRLK